MILVDSNILNCSKPKMCTEFIASHRIEIILMSYNKCDKDQNLYFDGRLTGKIDNFLMDNGNGRGWHLVIFE